MGTPLPATGLDLSAARFAVTWRAPGTLQVLALDGDDVWFWTLASPAPAWAALAGTYRCEASGAERAALLDLAAQVASGTLAGSAGGLAVELAAAGRTVRVDAGTGAAARVAGATASLLDEARLRPVRAVRLRAMRVTPPGGSQLLGLTFTSIGSRPAVLGLDAGAVRLVDPEGTWHQVPAPRMGLVEGAGTLLDGLYAPATIPAGGTGAWMLTDTSAAPDQRVRAGGTIALDGPWPSPGALAFDLTAPLDAGP